LQPIQPARRAVGESGFLSSIIFETKIKQDDEFKPLRKLFSAEYKWKNQSVYQVSLLCDVSMSDMPK